VPDAIEEISPVRGMPAYNFSGKNTGCNHLPAQMQACTSKIKTRLI
jgi:hypothetical protein